MGNSIITDISEIEIGTNVQAYMFRKGQAVLHVKTSGRYIIAILPDQGVIEATGEAAYAYLGDNNKIYFRPQSEMEDGRFIACPKTPQNPNSTKGSDEHRRASDQVVV